MRISEEVGDAEKTLPSRPKEWEALEANQPKDDSAK